MGFGFIIGGFCPGTSLVAAATAKLDGLFFALGVFFGIFLFGETVHLFDDFWYASYMGRFTLPEWLGLDTGTVVLLVVLMALFMFWGAEQLERVFGQKDPSAAPRWRYGTAAALALGGVAVLVAGQPTTAERWQRISDEKEALLAERAVQIHPGELLDTIHDPQIKVRMIDVRNEADFNLFHILDAQHVPLPQIPPLLSDLRLEPANTVFVVMSNDEAAATEAWKVMVAESVPNVYILEGGVNNWIALFGDDDLPARFNHGAGDDELCYIFDSALGARYSAAEPDPHAYELQYTPKVKLDVKRGPVGGGCG